MTSSGWRGWLASPRAPLWLALAACLLVGPSLGAGLCTEDWVLRDNALAPHAGVNLYATLSNAAEVQAARAAGVLPWLVSPELRLSFFRPVSSLWALFDYRVLGDAAWLMHLESILLFGALVLSAARLFRRLMPAAWVAGLAGLIYAVDDAHGHAVGWLANRNALLASVFAVAALSAHARLRREGWRPGAWLAPAFVALSLGSSELGLGVFGYLAAYALFLDRSSGRALALLPVLAVALGWAVLYFALGHGAVGSGIYLDPLRAPLPFLTELPGRLGALLAGLLGYPSADAWVALGDRAHLGLALGGAALLSLLVLGLAGSLAAPELRFGLAGMLLSLVPLAATSPSDRTLFLPGLGAALCFGTLLSRAVEQASLGLRLLAVPFGALHLVVAPVLLPWRSLTMSRYHDHVVMGVSSAYASVISGDELVVALSAPDYYYCSLLRSLRRHVERGPAPPVVCLAAGPGRVEVERVDDNALALRVPGGYLEHPFNRLFRSRSQRFRTGESVYTGPLEALVSEVSERGEPLAVTFRFNWPLGSEKLRFVSWDGARFVPLAPPRAGEKRVLGGAP